MKCLNILKVLIIIWQVEKLTAEVEKDTGEQQCKLQTISKE